MARLVEDLLVLANGDLDALPAHLHPIAPDNLCLKYTMRFSRCAAAPTPVKSDPAGGSVPSIEADPDRVKSSCWQSCSTMRLTTPPRAPPVEL